MKLFQCQNCGHLVFFENTRCERCEQALGFLPDGLLITSMVPDGNDWQAAAAQEPQRICANAEYEACNWLLPAGSGDQYCAACRHNTVVPDLGVPQNVTNWRLLERAKHRLMYSLLRLGLPLSTRAEDPEHGLSFEFLADSTTAGSPKVMTGHDNGVITIALSEAEGPRREALRLQMGETYRTLLGHFRHEVGHHYWDLLVRDGGRLDACREVFGDERSDYNAALAAHYANGAPADWQANYISAYATSHPWEDFAETWAHYLHIVDTLDTAAAFGLRVRPPSGPARALRAEVDFNPYAADDAATLVDAWLPLTFAVNSLNRSMGQPDLYPFVLPPSVIGKLQFIHELITNRNAAPVQAPVAALAS